MDGTDLLKAEALTNRNAAVLAARGIRRRPQRDKAAPAQAWP